MMGTTTTTTTTTTTSSSNTMVVLVQLQSLLLILLLLPVVLPLISLIAILLYISIVNHNINCCYHHPQNSSFDRPFISTVVNNHYKNYPIRTTSTATATATATATGNGIIQFHFGIDIVTALNIVSPVHSKWRIVSSSLSRLYFDSSNNNNNYDDTNDNETDDEDDTIRQQQINYDRVRSILISSRYTYESRLISSSSSSLLKLKLIPLYFRNDGYIELPTTITMTGSTGTSPTLSSSPMSLSSSSSHTKESSSSLSSPSPSCNNKKQKTIMTQCMVLQETDYTRSRAQQQQQQQQQQQLESKPSLLVPMMINQDNNNKNDWWLLQQSQQQRPFDLDATTTTTTTTTTRRISTAHIITKFDLRQQNSIVINHPSYGLYDNLPYHWWYTSINNNHNNNNNHNSNENQSLQQQQQQQQQESSSRGRTTPSSSLGKRECYNLLLGKDWYLWNIKQVATAVTATSSSSSSSVSSSATTLQSRIIQLQTQEYLSQMAECDSEISCLQQQHGVGAENDDQEGTRTTVSSSSSVDEKDLHYWQQQRDILVQLLQTTTKQQQQQEQNNEVSNDTGSSNNLFTTLSNTLWSTIQRNFDDNNNVDVTTRTVLETVPKSASAATSKTRGTMTQTTTGIVPYRNTYDMIHQRIIQDMLQANVVGVLIENMSLLNVESGLTLGGVILLQKKPSTIQLLGETIPLSSSLSDGKLSTDHDGHNICFVECHVDEAIGMSLACNLPLWIEQETWERGAVMCTTTSVCNNRQRAQMNTDGNAAKVWYANDPELSVLFEGQSLNASCTERVIPIRIPRVTNLYDTMMIEQKQKGTTTATSSSSKDLFPTDNIIQSLQQYDQMSTDDKARTFMSMSNTQQIRLPRRRIIEQNPNMIDELLLPYIDESVRYEYNIRIAQQNGDSNKVQELEQQQSVRSKVRMNSIIAAEETPNDSSVKEYWDREIELYTSLRADITQDVGTYSRFLDRDEWYERDRRRMVQRMLDRQKEEEKKKNQES